MIQIFFQAKKNLVWIYRFYQIIGYLEPIASSIIYSSSLLVIITMGRFGFFTLISVSVSSPLNPGIFSSKKTISYCSVLLCLMRQPHYCKCLHCMIFVLEKEYVVLVNRFHRLPKVSSYCSYMYICILN